MGRTLLAKEEEPVLKSTNTTAAAPSQQPAKPTVRRAIAFSFLDSYLGILLNLVSFTLLARLLTPQQIGLYSVVLAIVSVTQMIRDFGLVNFIIQKKELTDDYVGSAWGMSLILGGSLFVFIQACAPLVGQFYNDTEIVTIVRVVALSFLLLPFNSVCLAMLRRGMQFPAIMRINLVGALSSTATTLLLAWFGWGALSLAIGSFVTNVVVMIGVTLTGAARRLRRPNLMHWREILRFGGPLTFSSIITSIAMDINDLAVGKILDFRSVALVSRAQGLMNLFHRDFMNAVRSVAFPVFAEANRKGAALEEKFLWSLSAVTAIAWPFYGFAGLFATEVLRLMFGPQWDASAPLVPLFCAAGAFSALISLTQPLMLATGNANLVATADLIYQPIKAIVLTLLVYWFRDLQVFALGFLAMAILQVPVLFAIKQHCVPTNFPLLGRTILYNLGLSTVTLLPAFMVKLAFPTQGVALPMLIFLGCVAVTLITWLAMLWAMKHPLYQEALPMLKARLKR